jgi:hypothetical protein
MPQAFDPPFLMVRKYNQPLHAGVCLNLLSGAARAQTLPVKGGPGGKQLHEVVLGRFRQWNLCPCRRWVDLSV